MNFSWRGVFLLAIMLAFTTATTAALTDDKVREVQGSKQFDFFDEEEENQPSGLRGMSRFLAQVKKPDLHSCKKYPSVCLNHGTPGPNCCKNQCVNLNADRKNCGICGKKCKYTEECCNGQCVNLAFDKRHCGRCFNKCNTGILCIYGLCDYA